MLAIQIAGQIIGDFRDGAWYVDLAPIADADSVPITVARALGLPDQPGRSTVDTILRFIGDREMLLVLDNCEHLLDASSELSITLLDRCPGLTLLTTSREPIGLAGEVMWRVPSLSLADEAVELFGDRARLSRIERENEASRETNRFGVAVRRRLKAHVVGVPDDGSGENLHHGCRVSRRIAESHG